MDAGPGRTYRLPRTHRLGGRGGFAPVFDAKTRESRGPLVAYAVPNERGHWRLGISIGRKAGSAARRNRIKRLLRESFRLLRPDLPGGYDLVIVVRPHEPLTLADYRAILAAVLPRLHAAWSRRAAKPRAETPSLETPSGETSS